MNQLRFSFIILGFFLTSWVNAQTTDSWESLTDQGTKALNAGNTKEAALFFERALERARKGKAPSDLQYLQSLINLAKTYWTLNAQDKAVALYLEVNEICIKASATNTPEYAAVLNGMGNIYAAKNQLVQAEEAYLKAVEIRQRLLGKTNPECGKTLYHIGLLYYRTQAYEKAILALEEAKDILEVAYGKSNTLYLGSLNSLVNLYTLTLDYSKAEKLYLELTAGYKMAYGPDHPHLLLIQNTLSKLYYDAGDYEKAEVLFADGLEKIRKSKGKDHPEYMAYVLELAGIYFEKANYSKAELLFLELLEWNGSQYGKAHAAYAKSLMKLGAVYKEMGQYSRSEPYFLQAMEIQSQTLGTKHIDYVSTLFNLATLHSAFGNYAKAEPIYKEVQKTFKEVLGTDHPYYADCLNNLATLNASKGLYFKARTLMEEVVAINAKEFGKDHLLYGEALHNLAACYSPEKYAEAEPLFIEAKLIAEKKVGKEHPTYARMAGSLAQLYTTMGRWSDAEKLYLESLEILERVYGREHPSYMLGLNNTALLYRSMGNNVMAEKYFLQAIQLKQAEISRHFPSLSEKEKQAYLQANLIHFSNFENFCLYRYRENPDILSSLYNEKLVTKGLLFHTSNKMRSRILGSGNSTLIALYNQWHGKREALAKVYLMSRTEKIKNKIDLAKLEAEANALEKELSLKSEAVTGKDDKLYRWQEVKEKLKPGEAAIEIIRIPDRDDQSYWISYAVLIISPSTMSHPEIVLLKNGLSMENKFRKYYGNAIKQRFQDVESYRQYWGPIAGKLSGIKKVYLSPDGVFNQINLNALLNPATGKFVIDEIDIQLVGSTKELGTASKTSNRKVKDATLFGFPDYNNKAKTGRPDSARALPVAAVNATEIRIDSAQRFLNGENINELPGTQVEVQSIGTMLRNKNIQHREFMFEAATETELKKLNNPQVLHVATHGYFLSDQNELRKVQTDNPLLRSGLLFAGAKEAFSKTRERGLTDKDDGMLTAYEAMSLDLDQTDLVVLSACETGLGVSSNGEGVYGLQRAFQLAGAKAVLMSLWTVSDEATQKLMTLFYEKWLNGKSVREAFRTAQLELRKEYTEPFYWGAFVMMGN